MGAARLSATPAAPLLAALCMASAACGDGVPPVILAATTSTYDSGLLDTLIVRFHETHPDQPVRAIVAGSGEMLELGRRGDADLLLVHAPAAERRFMQEGHGSGRTPLMRNDFLIVGPPDDPAGVAETTDPVAAFRRIAQSAARFVSRGDSSGTHERELALWRTAQVEPAPPWYVESGQGQGTTLQIASERRAYALVDAATFTVLAHILDLAPLVRGPDPALTNEYSVILPTAAAHPAEARVLADWLFSPSGRDAIAGYRLPGSGRPLFTPLGPPDGDSSAKPSAPDEPTPDSAASSEDSGTPSLTDSAAA